MWLRLALLIFRDFLPQAKAPWWIAIHRFGESANHPDQLLGERLLIGLRWALNIAGGCSCGRRNAFSVLGFDQLEVASKD